jgi:hypothetical protein
MQLTAAEKLLARKELLEMLGAVIDEDEKGLPISQLKATKTFCKGRELSDKQVEQLLHSSPPVVEVQLRQSHFQRLISRRRISRDDGIRYENFYKLTDAGWRVIAALRELKEKS